MTCHQFGAAGRRSRLRLPIGVALASVLLTLAVPTLALDFYVSPQGDDGAAGTKAKPFATLTRARDAARQVPASQPRRIILRGGDYFNVSLTLGPEDSGLVIEAAPRERPVLFGGQPVTGWQKDGDRFYAAALPDFPVLPADASTVPSRQWEVRSLQVGGAYRPRARFPADGALEHVSTFAVPWMSTTGGGWKRPPTADELTTLNYRGGDLPADLDIKSAEITVYPMWDESCVGISAQDASNHTLKLAPPCGHPPGAFGVKKYVLWNIRQGLLAPGQWYHDRARNRLVYWPLPGQDMSRTQVIAPTVTTILRLRGRTGAPVQNVTVRGLSLAVTTVPLVVGGFAAARYDGAISLENVEHCRLSGLKVSCAAGQAIAGKRRNLATTVERCEVSDCGAGGIYVGGEQAVIADNHVRGIGRSYPSAVGIFEGGSRCRVAHNEVHDCTYSAINYGGEENIIEDNLLYDCMKVLHDGAAIYMFGAHKCVIRRNVARDFSDTGGYGASAYYLDEQSTNSIVEQNLALRVNWPSHNHMATNNVIRDNVFVIAGDAKITFPRSTGYRVARNIIYATGKIRLENPAAAAWSSNLFYSGSGRIEQVKLQDYSTTGTQSGPPGDTVVADPLFRDAKNGDYRFRPGSPALELGLLPLDVSRVGRTWR